MLSDRSISLLLVDDRPDKLLALETMLEPLGYNLRKVESGKEALRLLLKETFQLVILDVNMPGLSGFETATLIRERESLEELPIIFVSAFDATEQEIEQGYQLGAVDFIHTPIQPAVLRARVSTFVTLQVRTAELQKANANLREVNDQMSAFLYTVSHDLRAPLRSINSFSKILLEDAAGQLDKESVELLRRIGLSGLKMNALLDDLLRYSQLANSALLLQPVNMGDAVNDVFMDLEREIKERGAICIKAEDFPIVLGDPVLIGQVLCNLINNALKFTAPGTTPRVKVWWVAKGESARIVVEDNGIGIAPIHQERIFKVFERLHLENEFPGTGIGLAIVRRAVERMRGRIGLESETGKGSRFWFELPLSQNWKAGGTTSDQTARRGTER